MTPWWGQAREILGRGETAALVTVCAVQGSAPREAGTKMLVWRGGQHGTIGGGNLEFVVLDQARKLIASGDPWRFQTYPLGPLLGQCCGGRVGMLIERLDTASTGWLDEMAAMDATGHYYAIHSTLGETAVQHRVIDLQGVPIFLHVPVTLSRPDGATYDIGAKADPAGMRVMEHVDPRPSLYMFGAGHVGRALAPIVKALPFRVQWFDSRPDFAGEGVVVAADPVAEVAQAPHGAYFLIFTQSHDMDYALTRTILAKGTFHYCGLIGSATKRARFEKRLLADGIAPATLTRLTCPIGQVGLTSKEPSVLAVAIAAELLLTAQRLAVQREPRAVHAR